MIVVPMKVEDPQVEIPMKVEAPDELSMTVDADYRIDGDEYE